jgi:hypothetical protein
VGTPVFIGGKTAEELDAMRARLKGAIVFPQPPMTTLCRRTGLSPTNTTYVPAPPAQVAGRGAGAGRAVGG